MKKPKTKPKFKNTWPPHCPVCDELMFLKDAGTVFVVSCDKCDVIANIAKGKEPWTK